MSVAGDPKIMADIIQALDAVEAERWRQVRKFGHQRHSNPGIWLAILGEEFGEVCQAAGPVMGLGTGKPTDADDLYTELIQVAAVAVAWAEQIAEERRGTKCQAMT